MKGFENFDNYAQLTKQRDWNGICTINNVALNSIGTKKELNVLPKYLEDDEVVFALCSGIMSQTKTSNSFDWGANTWLVVLTNERFLFLDHAMLTSSVDTQSVRHDSVQAVSASQGWVFGKIQVDLGSRQIVIDNIDKTTVPPLADLANKWIRLQQKLQKSNMAAGGAASRADMSRNLSLLQQQVRNQERIIALLEGISRGMNIEVPEVKQPTPPPIQAPTAISTPPGPPAMSTPPGPPSMSAPQAPPAISTPPGPPAGPPKFK